MPLVTEHQTMDRPRRALATGPVTYSGITRGRPVWSFSGDVAPAWFRRSGARFVVTDGRLTLGGSEVAIGTVFTEGSL